MSATRPLLIAGVTALLLTGCVATDPLDSGPPAAIPSTGPSAPAPSSPAVVDADSDPQLSVTVESITHLEAGTEEVVPLDDVTALVALFTEIAGSDPVIEPVEGPPGYDLDLEKYDWSGVSLFTGADMGRASISIDTGSLNGTSIVTGEGIAVGSSRDDLTAIGAEDVDDADGDGVAEQVSFDAREVPGTNSLTVPGEVGTQFILALLDGDVIVQLQLPGNDFGDL